MEQQLKRTWDDKPMGPHPCKTCIHWNDNRCTGNTPWGHENMCDNCTYHSPGIYTQQQRDVMLYRLMRKLKHNQVIQLNKKDPLPVKFVKTSWDLKFIDVATKTEIVHVSRVDKRLSVLYRHDDCTANRDAISRFKEDIAAAIAGKPELIFSEDEDFVV